MTRARRAALACASIALFAYLAGASSACDDDALTEILVVVESDLDVPSAIDAIVVRARGPSGEGRDATASLSAGTSALPVTVALVPAGDALGPVEVTAEARLGAAVVVSRRARTRFLEGRVLVLSLRLDRACADREPACSGDDTCVAGACVPPDIAPESLPEWTGSIPPSPPPDAGPRDLGPRDGAIDADVDGAIDAGDDDATMPPPPETPWLMLEGAVPAEATYAFYMPVAEGETPVELTDVFEAHIGPSQNERGVPQDNGPSLSPDGHWLVVRTDRSERCPFGCVVLFERAHLDAPEIVRIGTDVLTHYFAAVNDAGDAIVSRDSFGLLSITRRRSDGDGWTEPMQIGATDHTDAQWIVVSPDGTRALYDCVKPGGHQALCEVGLDGTGFRVVVSDTDAPFGDTSDDAFTTRGDYTPDGAIVFEANWMGNQLWRIDGAGAITRVHDGFFTQYYAPCVLSDGRIVAYDGEGDDDIVVLTADGDVLFHLPLPTAPAGITDWFPGPLGC